MSQAGIAPKPDIPLRDPCAIIHNGVLYVYTPDAFQALPLKEGASWSKLAMGESVTGGVCVDATKSGDATVAGLYIVGGISDTPGYSGIQKYSFASQSWESVNPTVVVTKNRIHHGAAFIPASSSIFVYGGSQDGHSDFSTQTFSISLVAPHGAEAYTASAPPVVDPLIMNWTDDQAVIIGGSTTNRDIYTFQPSVGWANLGTSLPNSLPSRALAQAVVVDAPDGGKAIQIIDTSVSPTRVSRFQILGPGGTVLPPETVAVDRNGYQTKRRQARNFMMDKWPTYDTKFAPPSTQPGFALASSQEGQIVLVSIDPKRPVSIFNQKENAWVDTQKFFGIKSNENQNSLTPNTSEQSSPSASVDPLLSSSPSNKPDAGVIAGAVIGGVCALILLVGLIFYLRYRRAKAKKKKDDDSRLSFNDKAEPKDSATIYQQHLAASAAIANNTAPSVPEKQAESQNVSSGETIIVPTKDGKAHRAKPSDASSIGLLNAGSSPGYYSSANSHRALDSPVPFEDRHRNVAPLPQITVHSPQPSYSATQAEQDMLSQRHASTGILMGAVPSGTVSAAVVPAGGSSKHNANANSKPQTPTHQAQETDWALYFQNASATQSGEVNGTTSELPRSTAGAAQPSRPYRGGENLSMDFTIAPKPALRTTPQASGSPSFYPLRTTATPVTAMPVDSPQQLSQNERYITSPLSNATSPGQFSNSKIGHDHPGLNPYSLEAEMSLTAPRAGWVASDSYRPSSSVYGPSVADDSEDRIDDTFGSGIGFGAGVGAGMSAENGYSFDASNSSGAKGYYFQAHDQARNSALSTVTVFPTGRPSVDEKGESRPLGPKQDMSWFNLGTSARAI